MRSVENDDAAGRLRVFVNSAHDHTIMQRTELHGLYLTLSKSDHSVDLGVMKESDILGMKSIGARRSLITALSAVLLGSRVLSIGRRSPRLRDTMIADEADVTGYLE